MKWWTTYISGYSNWENMVTHQQETNKLLTIHCAILYLQREVTDTWNLVKVKCFYFNIIYFKGKQKGGRVGSVFKCACCSFRRPAFDSQHPHWVLSRRQTASVSGTVVCNSSSRGSTGTCRHVVCVNSQGVTHTYTSTLKWKLLKKESRKHNSQPYHPTMLTIRYCRTLQRGHILRHSLTGSFTTPAVSLS